MRTLVISGPWGKNAKEQPVTQNIPNNTRMNIFNGGTCDRLRAIMSLASEYDRLVWRPVFENAADAIDPTHYINTAATVLV